MKRSARNVFWAGMGAVALMSVAAPARAADPSEEECLAANGDWGRLRDAGKLKAARARLLVCAAPSCPGPVRDECTKRIDDVNAALPSVVLDARSGAGATLTSVKVTLDGEPLTDVLDGKAIALDPGPHTFVFSSAEGSAEQKIMVKEGAKDVSVTAVLGATAPPPPSPPKPQGDATVPPPPAESPSSMKTIGYVVGGVGLAGITLGGVFGIVAISKNSSANCHPNDCSNSDAKPADRTSAQGSADIATVGFIAGGVLTAAGVAFVLFAPKDSKADAPPTARWEFSPRVGANGGGLWLGRTW